MFESEKSKGHSILRSLVGIYMIRMSLEFEIIPTILVGVATIAVYQTATIVIGIVTIEVMIATIVVDCDNCEHGDHCGHVSSPHGLRVENFVHCNCRGAIRQLFKPTAFRRNDVV